MVELRRELGDQKIDLVIHRRAVPDAPIYRIAQDTGILLWIHTAALPKPSLLSLLTERFSCASLNSFFNSGKKPAMLLS
ncbi:hypothetical protein [Halomonas sp. NO4]|uniref:hypothetical protein n=1 Tax=Halomonas sp. NO4 TaxID=2484813 RepID=UPI0013D2DDB9|nr:hypothetical protein [Halomonas sp. NO4]